MGKLVPLGILTKKPLPLGGGSSQQAIPSANSSDYRKACTIARRATANKYGLAKSIDKKEMTANQLKTYNKSLQLAVVFMIAQNSGACIEHVSDKVYDIIGSSDQLALF